MCLPSQDLCMACEQQKGCKQDKQDGTTSRWLTKTREVVLLPHALLHPKSRSLRIWHENLTFTYAFTVLRFEAWCGFQQPHHKSLFSDLETSFVCKSFSVWLCAIA